jgi:hypothetical protein
MASGPRFRSGSFTRAMDAPRRGTSWLPGRKAFTGGEAAYREGRP